MSGEQARSYAFGNFRLYPEEALLLRSGQPVPLPPKTFKMLCVLVENRGHLVDKDTLMQAVWPDTFVIENNLRYNISLLRKALSDNGSSQEFILTLPKHGYKFIGDAQDIDPIAHGPASTSLTAASPSTEQEALESGPRVLTGDSLPKRSPAAQRKRSLIGVVLLALAAGIGILLARLHTVPTNGAPSATIAVSRHAALSANPEANGYFERGVHVLDRRSTSSGTKGKEALERAVAIDPNFALAYAHLAFAYAMSGDIHLASDAAHRALTLDESLPEAHASLGFIAAYYDWDWKTAERELRRSIDLDPGYARGHHWLANIYEFERRFPEADREMQTALKLDPLSPVINSDLCELLHNEEQFDAAIAQCEKTIDMDPDFLPARGPLEAIYLAEKKYALAADTAIEEALKTGHDSSFPQQLRTSFQTLGIRGLLQAELEHFEKNSAAGASPLFVALGQIRLGDKEEAMQTLVKLYQSHDFFLPWIACEPEFTPLRSDPRFVDIVRRMGLS